MTTTHGVMAYDTKFQQRHKMKGNQMYAATELQAY